MGTELFVGIDVSKEHLDVAVESDPKIKQFSNDQQGVDALVKHMKSLAPALIVIEATGGFETMAASSLYEAGLPPVIVNPRQIRDFAKSVGILAKTDAIDARVICRFGRAVKPEPRPVKDHDSAELTAQVTRRRQIVKMLVAEQNRLKMASKRNKKDIQAHIKWLKKRLKLIDGHIRKQIEKSPVWRYNDDILQSMPGIGPSTSAKLLSGIPELGEINQKAVAMLIGLAPLNRDSGKFKGCRRIWGGRSHVRAGMYMATLTAIRCNPIIRDFYQRLTGSGKPHKVALTACMRKLLITANAMVRDQTKWQHC